MRVGITSILFSPSPLSITVTEGYPSTQADVLICTFSAVNKYYYKYSVFGVNIVLLNLLPVVLAALFFAYIPYIFPWMKLPDEFMFCVCLLSAIPLAYYIGLALSRFILLLPQSFYQNHLPSSLVCLHKHHSLSEQY